MDLQEKHNLSFVNKDFETTSKKNLQNKEDAYKYLLQVLEELMTHFVLPEGLAQKYQTLKKMTLKKFNSINSQSSSLRNSKGSLLYQNSESSQKLINQDIQKFNNSIESPNFNTPIQNYQPDLQQQNTTQIQDFQFNNTLNQTKNTISQTDLQKKNKEIIENLCKFFSEMIDIIFGKYLESTEKLKCILSQSQNTSFSNNISRNNLLQNLNKSNNSSIQTTSFKSDFQIDQSTMKFIKKPLELEIEELKLSLKEVQEQDNFNIIQGIDLERYVDGHINNILTCDTLVDKVITKIDDKLHCQNIKLQEFTTRVAILDSNETALRTQLEALKFQVLDQRISKMDDKENTFQQKNNRINTNESDVFKYNQSFFVQEKESLKQMQQKLTKIEDSYQKALQKVQMENTQKMQNNDLKIQQLQEYKQLSINLIEQIVTKYQDVFNEYCQENNQENNNFINNQPEQSQINFLTSIHSNNTQQKQSCQTQNNNKSSLQNLIQEFHNKCNGNHNNEYNNNNQYNETLYNLKTDLSDNCCQQQNSQKTENDNQNLQNNQKSCLDFNLNQTQNQEIKNLWTKLDFLNYLLNKYENDNQWLLQKLNEFDDINNTLKRQSDQIDNSMINNNNESCFSVLQSKSLNGQQYI